MNFEYRNAEAGPAERGWEGAHYLVLALRWPKTGVNWLTSRQGGNSNLGIF